MIVKCIWFYIHLRTKVKIAYDYLRFHLLENDKWHRCLYTGKIVFILVYISYKDNQLPPIRPYCNGSTRWSNNRKSRSLWLLIYPLNGLGSDMKLLISIHRQEEHLTPYLWLHLVSKTEKNMEHGRTCWDYIRILELTLTFRLKRFFSTYSVFLMNCSQQIWVLDEPPGS